MLMLAVVVALLSPALALPRASNGVVLIIGGDAGRQIGAYGQTDINTPNLDALAKTGVRFDRAHGAAVAGGSSSRSAILTGLPSHQNGMFGSHANPSAFQSHSEVRSVSKILSANNVKTGIIGISSVGPDSVFSYDYSQTEANNDPIGIGRNITLINSKVKEFLSKYGSGKFFLVISLGDNERCPDVKYGVFCEKYGENGGIPDWKPETYNASLVKVPYFTTDRPQSRAEIAALYRTANRADQGIGLYLKSLSDASLRDSSLVLYTSTGGVSFPGAKYNSYEGGLLVPLIGSTGSAVKANSTNAYASSLDIVPTVLDYLGVSFPNYQVLGRKVVLTGKSILPIISNPGASGHDRIFATQDFGTVNEHFPIRSIKNASFKLVRNWIGKYPIAREIFSSATFQSVLDSYHKGVPSGWWISIVDFEKRSQYELYDYSYDPYEVDNVAYEPKYQTVFQSLLGQLNAWQEKTGDPWLCTSEEVWANNTCQSVQ